MVAVTANPGAAPRPADLPRSLLSGRAGLARFTVDDVLAMIRQGILPEDSTTELLNGVVVLKDRSDLEGEPHVHGPKHRMCVRRLTALAARVDTPRRHAQVQLPVVCGPDQMPEPDFAIVHGTDEDYAGRLPTAAEVFVVVEAADSSLQRDAEDKLAIFAAAGVPQYVILNLRNSTAERYTDPDREAATYRTKVTLTREQSLSLPGGPDGPVQVQAAELLP